jgi:hypothetical protein
MRLNVRLRAAIEKHRLRVPGSEVFALLRRSRLKQQRGTLRRRLGEVDRVALVVGPIMPDGVNARGVGHDRVVVPALLPELVNHGHAVFRDIIAKVVRGLLFPSRPARRAIEIAGDDVPADTTFGQMIERRLRLANV